MQELFERTGTGVPRAHILQIERTFILINLELRCAAMVSTASPFTGTPACHWPASCVRAQAAPTLHSGLNLRLGRTPRAFLTHSLFGCQKEPCKSRLSSQFRRSGRRQGHPCRPPTPPAVRFRNGRFRSSVSGVSFVSLTIRQLVSGHLS